MCSAPHGLVCALPHIRLGLFFDPRSPHRCATLALGRRRLGRELRGLPAFTQGLAGLSRPPHLVTLPRLASTIARGVVALDPLVRAVMEAR